MDIFISTNIFNKIEHWESLPSILIEGVGIEVFPLWKDENFECILKKYTHELLNRPITFHSPYYGVEPSLSQDEIGYHEMMESQLKTLEWAKRLKSNTIVFHHNNARITDKPKMLKSSHENYQKIQKLSKPYNIVQLVENAGVKANGNMLLDEDEFIYYCKTNKAACLIDVGHANANGWNIKNVLSELKDYIKGFHLHNNDGISDTHKRILDGSFDMEEFAKIYKKYTPEADLILEYSPILELKTEDFVSDIDWVRKNFK